MVLLTTLIGSTPASASRAITAARQYWMFGEKSLTDRLTIRIAWTGWSELLDDQRSFWDNPFDCQDCVAGTKLNSTRTLQS